jgi:hypothetical protein
MVREIKESDWKLFRRLRAVALERFCQHVIEEINHTTSNCTGDYHKRYLEVFSLIRKRDKELGRAFDDVRRSNAFILLASIKASQLLTDEEFSQFSQETRAAVEVILEIRHA